MPENLVDPFPSVSASLADARALDDQELVDAIAAEERRTRASQARQAALIAEMNQRVEALNYPVSGAADTLAVTLTISPRSADHLLDTSVEVCDREVVWVALAEGRIDRAKAVRIVRELAGVPDPRREYLELLAIEYAQTHTGHQLHKRLLQMTCDADPDETLRKKAIDDRGVWTTPRGHGMADIHGYLSAEQAEAFMQALDQVAAAPECADPYDQGDARTDPQRRADALVGFLAAHTTWDVAVDVVISADALIGDNDWTPQIKRLGPIASSIARDLCFSPDARWRRLVTEPVSGRLVDMSADSYRIPKRIREAVKARDVTCRFPGCHQPAEYFDCDHIVAWSKGGRTRAVDLAGECRRHHRVKTHSAWKVRHDPTRPTHDMFWTSPLGTCHKTTAHNYHRRTDRE
jgi:hypothetical protein